MYERWDGKGFPRGLRGDEISLAARALHFGTVVELHRRIGGVAGAVEVARARRGGELDPAICDLFLAAPDRVTRGLEGASACDPFLAEEPLALTIAAGEIPAIALACARYVDHKSVFTLGHSTGVAELVARAGEAAGCRAGSARI